MRYPFWRVLDKEYLARTRLAQSDDEGLRPTGLLLFNVAQKIRAWTKDNVQALDGFFNDFLINEAKRMWGIVSESFSVQQWGKSNECFMNQY